MFLYELQNESSNNMCYLLFVTGKKKMLYLCYSISENCEYCGIYYTYIYIYIYKCSVILYDGNQT